MFADARLIAAKDLRIEWRSRVAIGQMLPFAVLVLILFGLALDPDRGVLTRATAGLYWVAVLFSALLAVQRAFAIEAAPGVADALRLSGIDPAGYFLGKCAAIAVQVFALEAVLAAGVVVLYGAELDEGLGALGLLVATAVAAMVAISAAATLYGVLAAGLRVRDTLLPLLLLPVLAPVLLGATRATETALGVGLGSGWAWCGLLGLFGVAYLGAGILFLGTLLEET